MNLQPVTIIASVPLPPLPAWWLTPPVEPPTSTPPPSPSSIDEPALPAQSTMVQNPTTSTTPPRVQPVTLSDDVADSMVTTTAAPASIERVTLSSGGPPIVPSSWPMILGGTLITLAIVCAIGWFMWQRMEALRAAGLLLRARFLRTPTEWRAVSAVAREAKLPVATVLLSRTAFARGAKVIVESKDPPFTPVILQRIDQRVFG